MPPPRPSNPSTNSASTTSSGIITSPSGERHIPSSTRADGSTRKEIRIRPGYRPPEDIETYKNSTAEAWKNRGKGGVPGAEGLKNDDKVKSVKNGNQKGGRLDGEIEEEDDEEDGGVEIKSAASAKNAKRREARKKAAAAAKKGDGRGEGGGGLNSGIEGGGEMKEVAKEGVEGAEEKIDGQTVGDEGEVAKAKEVRKLKKKLREARELREKKDKGGELTAVQSEKVGGIEGLVRELERMGVRDE